ncbi:hypothetical protein SLE2022_266480 [Rubroshorea leprosula]
MSLDTLADSTGSDVTSLNFEDTELTLGLPGGESRLPSVRVTKSCSKRGFTETVDLNSRSDCHRAGKPPAAKAQVVGWPPVRSWRQKAVAAGGCKYVKVAVDGAPYLRKVNLEEYASYKELLEALEKMFSWFTINWNYKEESKVKGMEYVPTYEDKDSDWMMVGDVPWKMFMESCKRIRLMKSSEAAVLGENAQKQNFEMKVPSDDDPESLNVQKKGSRS